jgi:hypothetical protein
MYCPSPGSSQLPAGMRNWAPRFGRVESGRAPLALTSLRRERGGVQQECEEDDSHGRPGRNRRARVFGLL